MQTEPKTGIVTPSGVYVPSEVIDQIDEALASLYGLIESAIAIIESDLPEGIETTVIPYGLVANFFIFYHVLNDAQLLAATSFDTGRTVRPWRTRKRRPQTDDE